MPRGISWAIIGGVAGTSGPAAQQRYGKLAPPLTDPACTRRAAVGGQGDRALGRPSHRTGANVESAELPRLDSNHHFLQLDRYGRERPHMASDLRK